MRTNGGRRDGTAQTYCIADESDTEYKNHATETSGKDAIRPVPEQNGQKSAVGTEPRRLVPENA